MCRNLVKDTIKFEQFNIECYMVKMTPVELINNSTVAVFNPDNAEVFGYQRPLNLEHANQIAQYLLNNEDPIMLSTFLCAIDEEDMEFQNGKITINSKFRVIDGQHRIEGLKLIAKYYEERFFEINEHEYAVIICAIKPDQRVYEISTFIDINSKSKKVSTDLAIQLRSKIREEKTLMGRLTYDEQSFIEEVLNRVVNNLGDDEDSVWYKAFKNASTRNGIISINAFINSLRALVKKWIKIEGLSEDLNLENLVRLEKDITNSLKIIWDMIFIKWENCFDDKRFSKQFNIQKGIGVNAFHILFTNFMETYDFNQDNAISTFEQVIMNSNIAKADWLVSGPFGQFSSSAGYRELAKVISNG